MWLVVTVTDSTDFKFLSITVENYWTMLHVQNYSKQEALRSHYLLDYID